MNRKVDNTDFSLILASSVHDMKNSLGMLLHSLEALCEKLPEDEGNALGVSTIRYEAERVNNDLIQLLGLYRIQKKSLSAHVDEHYLDDIFAEQKAQFDEIFLSRGIELEIQCNSSLAWFFDRELVCGIINNALNNASRYTTSKIVLSAHTIRENDHEFLEIKINDDGKGYPDEILELNPSDIQNNLNFRTGSTSLGLYFASQVASLHSQGSHQGHLQLSNGGALGGGVFAVRLP